MATELQPEKLVIRSAIETVDADFAGAAGETGPARTPRRPLRVLHVVAPAPVGGLEQVVHALTAGHVRRGHQVTALAMLSGTPHEHPFRTTLERSGVPVREAWIPTRAYLRERAILAELCNELRPDVVHTHGYRPDTIDGTMARRLGVPVVSTIHGFIGGSWRGRLYEKIQCRALRRFDAVVAVSAPVRDRLVAEGIAPSRVHLVPNAWPETSQPLPRVEAREKLGLDGDTFEIGWLGRASYEKGPDVLIDALERLGDVPWRASVIGGGPMVEPLRARLAGSTLGERVRWLGPVPLAGALLGAFDLFVLSSRTEGTPIVLFEAMAAGCPVVATRVGGVPDVVSSDQAVLVASEDPAALAAAIRECLSNAAAARGRSGAATERLEDFRVEPWLDEYESLYRRLVPSSTSGGK